jgi:hypothetical protein
MLPCFSDLIMNEILNTFMNTKVIKANERNLEVNLRIFIVAVF